MYRQLAVELWSGSVPLADLVLQARVGKDVDKYKSSSPVAVCLRMLKERGMRVPAGQTVRYVITARKHKQPSRRYLPELLLAEARDYDAKSYEALLLDAFEEVVPESAGFEHR